MQIGLQQLSKRVIGYLGTRIDFSIEASSPEAGYHHHLMVRYQQLEMCIKKLQMDVKK
jgi:hypothetical protein